MVSLERGEAAITFDSNILNQHKLPELIVNCNPNKFKVSFFSHQNVVRGVSAPQTFTVISMIFIIKVLGLSELWIVDS